MIIFYREPVPDAERGLPDVEFKPPKEAWKTVKTGSWTWHPKKCKWVHFVSETKRKVKIVSDCALDSWQECEVDNWEDWIEMQEPELTGFHNDPKYRNLLTEYVWRHWKEFHKTNPPPRKWEPDDCDPYGCWNDEEFPEDYVPIKFQDKYPD